MITHSITKENFLSPQLQHTCAIIGAAFLVVCVSAGWLKYLSFQGAVTAGAVGMGLLAIALANQRQLEAVRRSPLLVQRREFWFEDLEGLKGAVYLDEKTVACVEQTDEWGLTIRSSEDPQRKEKRHEPAVALSKEFIVTGHYQELGVWSRHTGAEQKLTLPLDINKISYDGRAGLIYVYLKTGYGSFQDVLIYNERIEEVAKSRVSEYEDILFDPQGQGSQWHFSQGSGGCRIRKGGILVYPSYSFQPTSVSPGRVFDRKQVVNGKAYYIGKMYTPEQKAEKKLCVIDVANQFSNATVLLQHTGEVWDFYICGNRVVIAIEGVGVVLFDLATGKQLEVLGSRPCVSFGYFKGKVLSYWDWVSRKAVWLTLPDRLAPSEDTSLEKL